MGTGVSVWSADPRQEAASGQPCPEGSYAQLLTFVAQDPSRWGPHGVISGVPRSRFGAVRISPLLA